MSLTGIENVDSFIDALPAIYSPDKFSRAPVCFGFRATGDVDIVEVEAPELGRDAFMDASANLFIAYVKTVRPIAIVTVSEAFITTRAIDPNNPFPPSPPPVDCMRYFALCVCRRDTVDCKRFNRDKEYRARVLRERQEVLFASIETPAGRQMIRWAIVRDGGNVRLGKRSEDVPQRMSGRLVDLLTKAHAADRFVEQVPKFALEMAALTPEPIREQRSRLGAAMQEIAIDMEPSRYMDHYFDFPEMRLMVGVLQGSVTVMAMNYAARMPLSVFRPKVLERVAELFARPIDESLLDPRVKPDQQQLSTGAAGFHFKGMPESWPM